MDENILNQMRQQTDQDNEKTLLRMAAEKLNKTQQDKFRSLLADPDAMRSLLQSERAQALLRKLQK